MDVNDKIRILNKYESIFNIISMAINVLYLIWWICALIHSVNIIDESNNFHSAVFIDVSIIFIIVSAGIIALNIFAILKERLRNPFSIVIAIYLIISTYMFLKDRIANVHNETIQTKDVLVLVLLGLLMAFSILNAFVHICLKIMLDRNGNNN